jgi:hypothetical protein
MVRLLTKPAPSRIVKEMRKSVRLLPAFAAPLVFCAFFGLSAQDPPSGQDSQPIRRPDTDYMSQWSNRNTKALGLGGEDKMYRKLVNQPRVNWAIRAAARHILD